MYAASTDSATAPITILVGNAFGVDGLVGSNDDGFYNDDPNDEGLNDDSFTDDGVGGVWIVTGFGAIKRRSLIWRSMLRRPMM